MTSAAPLATVKALSGENALATPACKMPALTLVASLGARADSVSVPAPILVRSPEYELFPVRVIVPLPILVSQPVPESVPAAVGRGCDRPGVCAKAGGSGLARHSA